MVVVDAKKCTGCGSCAEVCPADAITIENDLAIVNEDCIDCLTCIDECPENAISEGE